MATRVVEGKKPYTGGKAISIDENKVISLNLRDENNLIIYDAGDDEIYVDLQLDDEITPTSAFPIGVNVGRVIVDNGWDKAGTIISAVTTSGDNIKIFYADEGTLWIDNGTGTFKQIYFKADVDAIVQAIWNYISANCNTKTFYDGTYGTSLSQAVYDWISQGNFGIIYFNPVQGIKRDVIFPPTTTETGTISSWSYTDVRQATGGMFYEKDITGTFTVSDGVVTSGISFHGTVINNEGRIILSQSTAPSNPLEGTTWYDTTSDTMKVWDGTAWQSVGTGGGDVLVSDQANNIFTPGMKIWGGTEGDYQSLTPDSNTAYLLLAGGPTPPSPWQPGVDTVLYYDFEHTNGTTETNMAGISNYDGTYTTTPTISTLASGKKYFNGSNSIALYSNNRVTTIDYANATLNVWVKIDGQNVGNILGQARWNMGNNPTIKSEIYNGQMTSCLGHSSNELSSSVPSGWSNVVLVNDGVNAKIYINGTLANSKSFTSATKTEDYYFYVNAIEAADETPPPRSQMIGSFSFGSVIIENKTWTAQEIQDYYDQTKGDYGIS